MGRISGAKMTYDEFRKQCESLNFEPITLGANQLQFIRVAGPVYVSAVRSGGVVDLEASLEAAKKAQTGKAVAPKKSELF
jgi:hypothetical protein